MRGESFKRAERRGRGVRARAFCSKRVNTHDALIMIADVPAFLSNGPRTENNGAKLWSNRQVKARD